MNPIGLKVEKKALSWLRKILGKERPDSAITVKSQGMKQIIVGFYTLEKHLDTRNRRNTQKNPKNQKLFYQF